LLILSEFLIFFVAKKFIAIFFNVWKLKKKSLPYFNVENIFVAKKSNKKNSNFIAVFEMRKEGRP
jgi:hypothetical protein